jgi:hypothetical protein
MKSKYPNTLIIWGITWTKTKGRRGWIGPAITDPEDRMLALCVEYQRIVRRDGYYIMEDPSITLDRFGWDEDAGEGMTWRRADGTIIDMDADDEDNQ